MYFKLTLLLVLVVMTAPVGAAEYRPYVDIQSIFYSEPIAIKSIMDKWQTPFKRGSKALTYSKAETGMRWGGWQLGIVERLDYQMKFSAETAKLIYLTENRLPLEVGKEYEISAKAQHNYSRGLRLGYRRKLSQSIQFGAAASYLQGRALTDGSIQGTALATGAKDYDFQFNADYFYSRDVLFERDVSAPSGKGYSLDVNFDWHINNRLDTHVEVVDLLGKMFWDNAPVTTATASSDTKTFDADGYVRYKPAISGYESNRNFTQTLPRKIFINANYQWSPSIELLAELQDFGVERFSSIGAGWCHGHNDCIQGFYNTTAKALSLRYLGHGLRLELASDKFDINQARYFALQFAFNRSF